MFELRLENVEFISLSQWHCEFTNVRKRIFRHSSLQLFYSGIAEVACCPRQIRRSDGIVAENLQTKWKKVAGRFQTDKFSWQGIILTRSRFLYCLVFRPQGCNKKLSCRKETVRLLRGSVLAKY